MDITKESPTVLSLCSGYGGIEEGLRRVFGDITVLAHVEIEAFAIANLVNKMETRRMVPAPVWTDLKTFNAGIFRGSVDILTGGYPCQPFSAAGKRAGTDDPRHLWPYIKDIVRDCEPGTVFFENVEGHLSLGVSEVLADLEEMGYRATAGIFSAAEVGASHQRKRVFILGHAGGSGCEALRDKPRAKWEEGSSGESGALDNSLNRVNKEDSERHGKTDRISQINRETVRTGMPLRTCRELPPLWPSRPGQPQYDWEQPRVVVNSNSRGLERAGAQKQERDDVVCTNRTKEQGTLFKPQLGRAPDGSTDRVDRLRLLGNGVVPQTVEKAFRVLSAKLTRRTLCIKITQRPV